MSELPKVTFAFVNCNRLHYLKACLESLLYCTDDYPNKEIIIVDNASVEDGTEKYLREKEEQGALVFRQEQRDPSNEFARALNLIAEHATGEFILPLQADTQFVVRGGWLQDFVEVCSENLEKVGYVLVDAQRAVRDSKSMFNFSDDLELEESDAKFAYDLSRYPIVGAADVMYTKFIMDKIKPWHVDNESHEGGKDSETEMLTKISGLLEEDENFSPLCLRPIIPVSCAIHTDLRGTNARVRGDKRYGNYWKPPNGNFYYKIHEYENLLRKHGQRYMPVSIEELVVGDGWDTAPLLTQNGEWKKCPIDPEQAAESDYERLY